MVPTTRRAPPPRQGLTVPTRWVKNIIAVFLLPWCVILTQTFFTAFTRATLQQRLWANAEFWFFALGVVLWLIAFFGLPRPLILYVFGHELTHALWVWLMGGRVSKFRVGSDGGHIVTDRTNFWIALTPYFFPLYSVLAIGVYGLLSLFVNIAPYGQLLFAVIGITWAFHFTFTCWMIPKNQSDLSSHGTFFSLVFIYLMNLAVLSALLIIASPNISFASFGADLLNNIRGYAEWLGGLIDAFARGAQGRPEAFRP
ncbi:MAG: hypothetical protein M3R59_04205 [Verrucomicrobiota bacterium]|nr:hypothetical protein [Verrucomicrobiota bacterium]